MGKKSLLTDENIDTDIDFTEEVKRVTSGGGKRERKLPHNPDVYFCWFVANQLLNQYKYLPEEIVKDWKLSKYKLPKEWNDRSDVLSVCEKFLDKEGYRLFGEQKGKRISVIIDEKFLKFEPQEEILVKIPLNTSKTFSERMEEMKKLLKRVHKITDNTKDYPKLEGCDWNLKKKRKTAKYRTSMSKPRAGYFWEVVLFLKHYLEEGYEPQDMKRNMKQYKIVLPYFDSYTTQYWDNNFDEHQHRKSDKEKLGIYYAKGIWETYEKSFIIRFRKDTISLYKALRKGTFPR